MNEHVGRNVTGAGAAGVAFERGPHGLAAQAAAGAQVAEDVGAAVVAAGVQPGAEGVLDLQVHRDEALAGTLTHEAEHGRVRGPVDRVQRQIAGFGDPQTAPSHHLDQGPIAEILGYRAERLQFVVMQCFG